MKDGHDKDEEMGDICGTCGNGEKCVENCQKSEGKRPLVRQRK
jgi:hypothetical protein